ncbi:glycosyltransferase [Paraburkholderia sp.]|uniref:glycosyltransferase n=1 Tax=Paraburkholderia sp. TaxID=1926495 RepID=UPI002385E547|nr:glycosyltransferase [Paraburkholderia sp.]MDE1180425.1 glycosyltransferase [Paraburkholderia sp.]
MKVFILHPGKANYPEISAYSGFLTAHGFEVFDGDSAVYANFQYKRECVLWCIMGFYPSHAGERLVIHDYRSLSLGKLAFVKDGIKRVLNARSNVRIFQNERMREAMGFRDSIPSLLLPMGVPDWIFNIRDDDTKATPSGKFCYIGEMSRERGFDKVLAAYRDAAKKPTDTLVLVGNPEREIYDAFKNTPGIQFVGRVPQIDALRIVRRSEYAVCYFPYHRPHCFQTPTKLLEYAALGKKIICNDAPSNVHASEELGIQSFITGKTIFDDLPAVARSTVSGNDPDKLRGLEWTSVIAQSGVMSHIQAAISMRAYG